MISVIVILKNHELFFGTPHWQILVCFLSIVLRTNVLQPVGRGPVPVREEFELNNARNAILLRKSHPDGYQFKLLINKYSYDLLWFLFQS